MSTKKRPEVWDAVARPGALGLNQAAGLHEFHAGDILRFGPLPERYMALPDEDASKKDPRG